MLAVIVIEEDTFSITSLFVPKRTEPPILNNIRTRKCTTLHNWKVGLSISQSCCPVPGSLLCSFLLLRSKPTCVAHLPERWMVVCGNWSMDFFLLNHLVEGEATSPGMKCKSFLPSGWANLSHSTNQSQRVLAIYELMDLASLGSPTA